MRFFSRLELESKVLLLAAILFIAFVWPVQRFFIIRLNRTLSESIDPDLEQTLRNEMTKATENDQNILKHHIERYRQTKVLIPIIVKEQQRLLMALSIGLFITFLLIAFWVLRHLTRPLKNLASAVALIGKGKAIEFKQESGGALGIVETAVAGLQDELLVLREKERVLGMETAWKDIARIMAHEIKNPLTPIRLTLDRIEEKTVDGESVSTNDLSRFITRINTQVDMLERLVDQFRSFSREPEVHRSTIDIKTIIRTTADTMDNSLLTVISGTLIIESDPYLLQQIFLNIWKNSLDAGADRVDVLLKTDEHHQQITIADNGSGIPPKEIERIWLPYVTHKKNGTGLGLSVVKRLVETLDGTIDLTSVFGEGTAITITFPAKNQKDNKP